MCQVYIADVCEDVLNFVNVIVSCHVLLYTLLPLNPIHDAGIYLILMALIHFFFHALTAVLLHCHLQFFSSRLT